MSKYCARDFFNFHPFDGHPEQLLQETWVGSLFLSNFENIDDEDLVKDDLIDLRSKEGLLI